MIKCLVGSHKAYGDRKIGIVTAKFNFEITELLEKGALESLRAMGVRPEDIFSVRVPGAVEIPLAVKALFDKGCDGGGGV